MAGPSLHGLEPFKNLKRPNGSITLYWVGSMPLRKAKMESGSGRNGKAGSGPAGKHGPTSGSMQPDPGSIFMEPAGTANRSSSTTPAIPGDKPKVGRQIACLLPVPKKQGCKLPKMIRLHIFYIFPYYFYDLC